MGTNGHRRLDIIEGIKMTRREKINSLSDREFIEWLYYDIVSLFSHRHENWDEALEEWLAGPFENKIGDHGLYCSQKEKNLDGENNE